jgi:hypothetical protein
MLIVAANVKAKVLALILLMFSGDIRKSGEEE